MSRVGLSEIFKVPREFSNFLKKNINKFFLKKNSAATITMTLLLVLLALTVSVVDGSRFGTLAPAEAGSQLEPLPEDVGA